MASQPLSSIRALVLVIGLLGLPTLICVTLLGTPALAQDDDSDDDDDDDDDDVVGSDDDDRDFTPSARVQRPSAQRTPPAAPLPEQAPDQIVVQGIDAAAQASLLNQGFTLLGEDGDRLLLKVPANLNVSEALGLARQIAPMVLAGPNSYYRSQAVPQTCQGDLCGHWDAVGWPPASPDLLCRFEPYIGVIDTGLNLQHDMLSDAKIRLETIGSADAEPSEKKHGTAIAALFVGNLDSRVPGLAPAADILVVDPFGRVGSDERSDVFSLVKALDRLASEQVSIASLSLAGPANEILHHAIERLQAQNIPVVAAVGNAGARAEPLYPAAYPGVVAVTAVDGGANIYRRAVQGEHVSFAGPGVAIPTAASISGVRPQTGTSFAVPFVTTALAAAVADGTEVDVAMERLAQSSRDLGAPGRDPVFGWGLVQIPNPC